MSRKNYLFVTMAVSAAIFLFWTAGMAQNPPQTSPDKKAGEVYKNVQVLKDAPSDQLIPAMQFITASLGVHCEYCHVEKAFEKDDKKPKQIARKMMQMMFEINADNFDRRQQVTCFTCHRGSHKPVAIPSIAESAARGLNEQAVAEESSPAQPPASETIQKYIAAVGGAEAIGKLTSVSEQGTFHAGTQQFPVEVFKQFPSHLALVTHWPNGDSTTVFDGKSGWLVFPGRPMAAMSTGEADANKMDADLHFPIDLSGIFAELRVDRHVQVGNRDTVMISGLRPGQPPVEMYFDVQSGLLVRMVRYAQSPLGMNPTQVDYSDYRDIGGVKMPFAWTSATPSGRFTIEIERAKANASIPDNRFQMPTAASPAH